jgi:demethylmenaquinone methyltransferase/2-methoxy-6-polyprenyl-1,4-benzoquinol methylase
MTRAGLDKDPREVAGMFDDVARRYDLTNSVLSFGLDRYWRAVTARTVRAAPGERVLDLAAGTAVSTAGFARCGAFAVAADFSPGMLAAGSRRAVPRVAADALALPFAGEVFDVATVSFGLRNFTDTAAALAEMRRVVRPGGRLVICEFSTPTLPAFRVVYFRYLMRALPAIAAAVSSDAEAYRYLAESIRDWPEARELGRLIADAGWSEVEWRDLTGGIVAVHSAVRRESSHCAV